MRGPHEPLFLRERDAQAEVEGAGIGADRRQGAHGDGFGVERAFDTFQNPPKNWRSWGATVSQ